MRKAQAWGFDLIMAAIVFLAGIVIFYIYSLNYPTEGKENLDALSYEGNLIADNLLSSGFPKDWTKTNVVAIGIADEGKINETKLSRLNDLANDIGGYDKTRALFNTKFQYYFNLTEIMTIDGSNVNYIGQLQSTPKNLIKITRFTAYKNKPVTLNVYVWD